MTQPSPGTATRFDAQAAEFDRRAGLPEACARAVAASVLALSEGGPDGWIVEVGAGTGMIGRWFLDRRVRYIGMDLSRPMLEVFRERSAGRTPVVQADCAGPWPLPDGRARAVFASRVIHALPPEHAVAETVRVCAAGAVCLVGHVVREEQSVKARMSREMQQRLRDRGLPVKSAESRAFLEGCRARGAHEMPRTVVARWPVRSSPAQSLADWRAKSGLGGTVLPPGVQDEVLAELATWAKGTFGDLDSTWDSEDTYVLEGVRLPEGRAGAEGPWTSS